MNILNGVIVVSASVLVITVKSCVCNKILPQMFWFPVTWGHNTAPHADEETLLCLWGQQWLECDRTLCAAGTCWGQICGATLQLVSSPDHFHLFLFIRVNKKGYRSYKIKRSCKSNDLII